MTRVIALLHLSEVACKESWRRVEIEEREEEQEEEQKQEGARRACKISRTHLLGLHFVDKQLLDHSKSQLLDIPLL